MGFTPGSSIGAAPPASRDKGAATYEESKSDRSSGIGRVITTPPSWLPVPQQRQIMPAVSSLQIYP